MCEYVLFIRGHTGTGALPTTLHMCPTSHMGLSRVHDVLPGRSEGYNLLLLKDNHLLTLKQIEEKCCHFPIVPIYM